MDLITAIQSNHTERVKKLLEEGADPNKCLDKDNITPLHFAAQNNAIESAHLLITAGANLMARTADDQTPLDIAKLHQHHAIAVLLTRYLLASGFQN